MLRVSYRRADGGPACYGDRQNALRVTAHGDDILIETLFRAGGGWESQSVACFDVAHMAASRGREYFRKYYVPLVDGRLGEPLVWNDVYFHNPSRLSIRDHMRATGIAYPVFLGMHHRSPYSEAVPDPLSTMRWINDKYPAPFKSADFDVRVELYPINEYDILLEGDAVFAEPIVVM